MRWSLVLLGWLAVGCVGPEDNPTKVRDLRVLGISLEPPELMTPTCDVSPQATALWASPVRLTGLVLDPNGEGRALEWELSACAWPGDRTCSSAYDRVLLASGTTAPGELVVDITPGLTFLSDGTPLIQRVVELDLYKGLGGVRMPLLLHVRAGEEEIYAQKLMVFSCRKFPAMKANVPPKLPGVRLEGEPWGENDVPHMSGPGPFSLEPDDFQALQEPYQVLSFELEPVQLDERWKVSWHTELGTVSPGETGGTDLGGQTSTHRVEWNPGTSATEPRDVTFWAIVRDGRGGTSWLVRRLHYVP